METLGSCCWSRSDESDDGEEGEVLDQRSDEEVFRDHLKFLAEVEKPPKVALEELIRISSKFSTPFPVDTARLATLKKGGHDAAALEGNINSAYPLVHEKLLPLMSAFLRHKQRYGTRKERQLYKNLDLLGLVERLLKKRPVMFVNAHDRYMLRNGKEGMNGWEDIGKDNERPPLVLKDYMSYDEVKISALLCVSSRSVFINDGNRKNHGAPGESGTFQPDGVIMGMVGARMHRPGVMEHQDCVVTPEQNTSSRGYGPNPPPNVSLQQEWGRMWGHQLPTWDEAEAAPETNFTKLTHPKLFNLNVYKARVQMSAEILLAEAGTRAEAKGLKAYVHVVGLGLGVWRLFSQQEQHFVEAWGDALKACSTSHVAHVDFSWIAVERCNGVCDGEVFPGTNVTIHFSYRSLHDPVPSDTLLVCSFAWDGNSLPGNEYWLGSLTSTGDPAAACSSQVAELHNALINPRVSAANLHVATTDGVLHISDYAKAKLQQESYAG